MFDSRLGQIGTMSPKLVTTATFLRRHAAKMGSATRGHASASYHQYNDEWILFV